MNTNKIKTYAPKARRDFIAAVTRRAGTFGLTVKGTSPVREEGQLVLIEGQPYPKSVGLQRQKLAARVQQHGFEQTMEAAAYTWFNRLVAIRFMELHGYLDHSFRVLSHPAGLLLPEILGHAEHLDLPGLDRERVITLKMDGNRDEELYRDLLLAQCRALHRAMPFLFERVDDETELLLPDNLLQTDSLIRDLVSIIPEEDWQEVEIIGWLYQFYISEKKDQVIGKVVKSEDIPAATQLFTPNWIVQYLVQNSVGRLWLMANPESTLKDEWPYYIEPAVQTPEVQAQLDALIALRCREEVDSGKWIVDSGGEAASPPSDYPLSTIHYPLLHHYPLNPETITVLDPACGSGHILVVAYDVLKAIYLERGYRPRDIPRLILEKNLYGLDIDDRAAQLAGFALLMKARADDRRLLDDPPKLNVLALQESKGLDADMLARDLGDRGKGTGNGASGFAEDDLFPGTLPQMSLGESVVRETSGDAALTRSTIAALIDTFAEAKTFGSLIQVSPTLAAVLPELEAGLLQALDSGDVFARVAAEGLLPLVRQASVLAMQFDAVVANPPYMGARGMHTSLKNFAKGFYRCSKADLFSMFLDRALFQASGTGFVSMVTMHNWMFLSSFEAFRLKLLASTAIDSFVHLGPRAFREISGEVVQTAAFSLINNVIPDCVPSFFRLVDGDEDEKSSALMGRLGRFCSVRQKTFLEIPGAQIAYWVSATMLHNLGLSERLATYAEVRKGLATCDDARWVRYWFEVDVRCIERNCVSRAQAQASMKKWFPLLKGGSFRKWFGNCFHVVDWENDGEMLKAYISDWYGGAHYSKEIRSEDYYFNECITWSDIAAPNKFGARYCGTGFISSTVGGGVYADSQTLWFLNALLCSKMANIWLGVINPTLHSNPGDIAAIPLPLSTPSLSFRQEIESRSIRCGKIAEEDWNSFELSWDFQSLPILAKSSRASVSTSSEISVALYQQ
ncbi:BREX-1 system adenine-specific DNA-methyltransferase PglX [uncultured Lamprocystis sp.]|jgi:hypothetical protein|uniref:BREX-1 system adenine-specific DNA-methyltransferase PglX n=2 Tax=uncultured Lamprocystis sp. TaxID=543132 RepID=UPI0025E89D24|nr:BREX-1 system adenine-specific DNA-methyltransferase PglX [uncultured Lamprocystis sp.]